MSAPPTLARRRFGGVARLYGDAALVRLAAAHACVIGVGGVGSWAAEALARSGVGRLTLIDLDHVAESNINRQAMADENSLGMAKVEAMRRRIAAINPACRVECCEAFIAADNLQLPPDCDVVLDCIDQVAAKAALVAHCRQQQLAVIVSGGAGGRRDPTRVCVGDLALTRGDALAASLRARLRRHYGFSRDTGARFGVSCIYSQEPRAAPPTAIGEGAAAAPLACAGYGSVMMVTAAFGLAAAAEAVAILTR